MEGLELRADILTQLSIDEAILDYLLYSAIKSLLTYIQSAINGGLDAEKIELPLQLVDCKISIPTCTMSPFLTVLLLLCSFPGNVPLHAPGISCQPRTSVPFTPSQVCDPFCKPICV